MYHTYASMANLYFHFNSVENFHSYLHFSRCSIEYTKFPLYHIMLLIIDFQDTNIDGLGNQFHIASREMTVSTRLVIKVHFDLFQFNGCRQSARLFVNGRARRVCDGRKTLLGRITLSSSEELGGWLSLCRCRKCVLILISKTTILFLPVACIFYSWLILLNSRSTKFHTYLIIIILSKFNSPTKDTFVSIP